MNFWKRFFMEMLLGQSEGKRIKILQFSRSFDCVSVFTYTNKDDQMDH